MAVIEHIFTHIARRARRTDTGHSPFPAPAFLPGTMSFDFRGGRVHAQYSNGSSTGCHPQNHFQQPGFAAYFDFGRDRVSHISASIGRVYRPWAAADRIARHADTGMSVPPARPAARPRRSLLTGPSRFARSSDYAGAFAGSALVARSLLQCFMTAEPDLMLPCWRRSTACRSRGLRCGVGSEAPIRTPRRR